jgi:hypothetical protein
VANFTARRRLTLVGGDASSPWLLGSGQSGLRAFPSYDNSKEQSIPLIAKPEVEQQ